MANRPVFIPNFDDAGFVNIRNIDFDWFPGFAVVQKQKSIKSLHKIFFEETGISNILEISSKSENKLGIDASAFNLKLNLEDLNATVESIYQGSKVFEKGGPYKDLYLKSSIEAKKDNRIKESGNLIGFNINGEKWSLEDDFYSWLYMNALLQNLDISEEILKYKAFTDIEFNPKKSYNCQANSAAIYVSLVNKNMDFNIIKNINEFKKVFKKLSTKNTQLDMF